MSAVLSVLLITLMRGTLPAPVVADEAAQETALADVMRQALAQKRYDHAIDVGARALLPQGLEQPFDANELAQRDALAAALFAQACFLTGRAETAFVIYEALHKQAHGRGDSAIAARLAVRAADALASTSQWSRAISWYEQASSSDMLLRSHLGKARAMRHSGDAKGCVAILQSLKLFDLEPTVSLRAPLLAELARCAALSTESKLRMRALTALWVEHVDAATDYPGIAVDSEKATGDTDIFAGVATELLRKQAGEEGRVQRAERLLEINHLNEALQAARGAQAESSERRCRAEYVEGKTLRNLRRYSDATPVLEKVARSCSEQAPAALYLLGRVATFRGQYARALEFFERFVVAHPTHKFADDCLFFAGDVLSKQQRHSEAERYYQRVVDDYNEGDYHEQARWRLAWSAWLSGNLVQARQRLDAIAREEASNPDGRIYQQASYWRARIAATAGDRDIAIDELDALVRAVPMSYYGMQARLLLQSLSPQRGQKLDSWLLTQARKLAAIDNGASLPLPKSQAAQLGQALLNAGLDGEACEIFSAMNYNKLELGQVIVLANSLSLCGDTHAAHWAVRRRAEAELQGRPTAKDIVLWRAGYARGYKDSVERWADKRGLDDAIVYALIREESAFEAPVISWAGAIGLMQLMPTTAKEEAQLDGLKDFDLNKLTEPDLNVRLGSAHIARRVRTFKGNHALAIAAYNAGPSNVRKWQKASSDLSLDVFIETIPVEQTREYTKRVLQTWSVYRFLYEPEKPWVELAKRAE